MVFNKRIIRVWLFVIVSCAPAVVFSAEPGFTVQPALTPQGGTFFPIGWWYNVQRWYNGQTDYAEINASWSEIAAGGANTILVTNGPNFNVSVHRQYLDYAEQHGLKLIFSIFRDDLVQLGDPVLYPYKQAEIIATIESDLQHPNFLGYSLGDELRDSDTPPLYPSAESQQWVMDRVKERNPNVMVLQTFGATQELYQADGSGIAGRAAISDTLGFFRYPFVTSVPEYYPVSTTNNLLRINLNMQDPSGVVSSKRGIFHLEQAIGPEWNPADFNFRFPTYGELRYSQWAGIATNRQRGALYFEFGSRDYIVPEWRDFFDTVATPLIQEERQLQRAMETGWDVGTVRTNGDDRLWTQPVGGIVPTVPKVSSLLVLDGSTYYLILTNNRDSANTVNVVISDLPIPLLDLTATLLNETGTGKDIVEMSLGSNDGEYVFSVLMSQYDVDIYQLAGVIVPEPSVIVLLLVGSLFLCVRRGLPSAPGPRSMRPDGADSILKRNTGDS